MGWTCSPTQYSYLAPPIRLVSMPGLFLFDAGKMAKRRIALRRRLTRCGTGWNLTYQLGQLFVCSGIKANDTTEVIPAAFFWKSLYLNSPSPPLNGQSLFSQHQRREHSGYLTHPLHSPNSLISIRPYLASPIIAPFNIAHHAQQT